MDSDNSLKSNELAEPQVYNAIKTILIKRNDLNKIKAELRSKIVQILHEQEPTVEHQPIFTGGIERKNLQNLMNAMMLEYLEWTGYKYTLDIFSLESGVQVVENGQKENWRKVFKLENCDGSLPALAEIVINSLIDAEKEHCALY